MGLPPLRWPKSSFRHWTELITGTVLLVAFGINRDDLPNSDNVRRRSLFFEPFQAPSKVLRDHRGVPLFQCQSRPLGSLRTSSMALSGAPMRVTRILSTRDDLGFDCDSR